MLRIIKLGGSTLATADQVRSMAHALARLHRNKEKVVAVVSAMGKTTDALYELFLKATGGEADGYDLERFLSQGEWASAQLLAATLNNLEVPAYALTPWDTDWPLVVAMRGRQVPLRQKLNEQKQFRVPEMSRRQTKNRLEALLKRGIPVVTGFVAKNQKGDIVTLGRGGSDITAFLLGNILGADEVVLVKDVDGILAADPRVSGVAVPAKLTVLDAGDLYRMASGGSQVVHPGALKYLDARQKARVVSYRSKDLGSGGTLITKTPKVSLAISETPLAALTFIGRDLSKTSGILQKFSQPLSALGVSMYAITVSESFLALYIAESDCEAVYQELVRIAKSIPELKSSAIKRGLVRITLISEEFIEAPGAIAAIIEPIAKAGFNVWEVVTIHSDIMLFVESSLAPDVIAILKKLNR